MGDQRIEAPRSHSPSRQPKNAAKRAEARAESPSYQGDTEKTLIDPVPRSALDAHETCWHDPVMCNLSAQRKSAAEVAAHFGVRNPVSSNAVDESYPGTPGLVVREEAGERVMQSMTWGFPLRLKTMAPTAKPKPVNNIADLRKPMWLGIARRPQWRCLIPITGFAEAEGQKGAMTRTWFSIKDQPIFAWAGLWRISDEWGPVYSGLMTNANEAVAPVHTRMPVLLLPEDYDRWLNGSFEEAFEFQERIFPPSLIEIDRTSELWRRDKSSTTAEAPTLL